MSTEPRVTWSDKAGQTWRVELVADRWQLSRWIGARTAALPGETGDWQRVASYPTRQGAIDASIAPDLDALLEERDELIRRLTDRGENDEEGES
jgi:hypothetical protein